MVGKRHVWALGMLALGSLVLAACGVPSAGPGGGAGATPPPDAVSAIVAQDKYAPGDTVRITVTNNTGASVYYLDHKTRCTGIEVQRQDNGTWTSILDCRLGIVSVPRELKAGQSLNVELPPPQSGTWQSGTYRGQFSYSDKMDAATSGTVSTSAFTVG